MTFKAQEIIFKLSRHGWPLLTVPLLLYGGSIFPLFCDAWTVWIIRAWLPAAFALMAFVLYQQQSEGATIALTLSVLMALIFGALIAWHVCQQLIIPLLPRHLAHIPWFLAHVDWVNMGHGIASLGVGLVLAVRLVQDTLMGKHLDQHRRDTHGSARLATRAEIRQIMKPSGIPLGILPHQYDAAHPLKTVKAIQKSTGGTLLFVEPTHTMVIAPSGAGKGVGYVMPTLLEYPGPVFVTDIKGENYAITARHRRTKGRQVHVFDPFQITDTKSLALNPLESIKPDSPTAVDEAASIAQLICPTNRHASQEIRHFTRHGASLIHCLILYVLFSEDYSADEKHLGSVYDLLSLGDKGLKAQLEILADDKSTGKTMANLAATYCGTAEREFSGIANTARAQLQFIDSPAVRRVLQAHTFDVQDMTRGQTDFYLCIPPEYLDTHSALIRLIASLIFNALKTARGRRSPENLLMVIDEMPALDYVPQFEDILVYGRGYGVTLMGFSQTLELIQSVYPKTWRTFLSSNTTIFFDAGEWQTSEYVSQSLGRTTIEQKSQNRGQSKQKAGNARVSEQEGTTTSETGRPLLTPDEVACLGADISIVFMRGQRPIILRKPCYFRNKRWKGLFDANPLEITRQKKA